jgi:RimJ/RimL family protein N-acetyltransferase
MSKRQHVAEAIAIREARPEDALALSQAIETINGQTEFLGERGVPVPWADEPEARMREMRERQTGVYFIALDGADIIGFLGAFPGWVERTRGVIFIAHVGLLAPFRGRGIGGRMFAAIESWAARRGARRLELRVAETNDRARALYRSRGFVPDGRIADAAFRDGSFQADLWMGRVIAPAAGERWGSIEVPARPRPREVADLVVGPPRPADAAGLQAFERNLLSGSQIHLKTAAEVADVAETRALLTETLADSRRFTRSAFVGSGDARQIVGHITAWSYQGYRSERDALFALNVLPQLCGCGIGRRLVEALEAWGRAAGKRRLTTFIQAHNARGLRFAERVGFRREVTSPDYAVINGRVAAQVVLGKLLT